MESLKIDSYEFKLYEAMTSIHKEIKENIKEINDFCNLNTEIKNLNVQSDIAIFLEIYPHPLNGKIYVLDFINSVDVHSLKIFLLGLRHNNYIGILRKNNNPQKTIENLINYIKTNKRWDISKRCMSKF